MTGHLFHVTQRTPGVALWKAKGVISGKWVKQGGTENAVLYSNEQAAKRNVHFWGSMNQ
jgi:hypothetical protein